MDRSFIYKIRLKKSASKDQTPLLFLVGENSFSSREEFKKWIEEKGDGEFDLRTVVLVEELVDTKCVRPQFLDYVTEDARNL